MNKEDLYHPLILDRNKNPQFYRPSDKGLLIEAYNPVCGDEFSIRISLNESKIFAPTFYGYGCAISKASIDLLLERLDYADLETAILLLRKYLSLIESESPPDLLENPLGVFQRVKYHPARTECATLGANSLLSYLENLKIN